MKRTSHSNIEKHDESATYKLSRDLTSQLTSTYVSSLTCQLSAVNDHTAASMEVSTSASGATDYV